MGSPLERDLNEQHLKTFYAAFEREDVEAVRDLFDQLHPAEAALLIESLPGVERTVAWSLLEPETHAEVFVEAEDSVRAVRLAELAPAAIAGIARRIDADDAADLLQDLPAAAVEAVLVMLTAYERARIESVLGYPEDTAGGLMNLDAITVRRDVTIGAVIRYLRRRGEIPRRTNRLFVVDRAGRYEGMLRLADLLTHAPATGVGAVMQTEVEGIPVDTHESEVARRFEQRDLISAPVVDGTGRLLGRITVDDVVDVIRDEGEHSLMRMAGLDEDEDLFAPVLVAARHRSIWLGVNLATAILAAWVIGRFEATIQEVVALAVLMPVVASMGGIAGSQTLTIVIRAMALGQVTARNLPSLLSREFLVGMIGGTVWAAVTAWVAVWWFDDGWLGIVVAGALLLNLLVAVLSGAVIPLVLKRLRIDPALAGGVVLTTITDVVGFGAFLGLGTLYLLA